MPRYNSETRSKREIREIACKNICVKVGCRGESDTWSRQIKLEKVTIIYTTIITVTIIFIKSQSF